MNLSNISVAIETIEHYGIPVGFLLVAVVFGTSICATSLFAIAILSKCKKIREQIRITSSHLCIANLGIGLTVILNGIYFLYTGTPCGAIFKLMPFFCLLYFMILTLIGIDRLLSLTLTMTYNFWSRKRNMRIAAVAVYVTSICIGILPNLPQEGFFQCQGQFDETFTYSGRLTFVTTMILLILTNSITFLCIKCIVVKKAAPGRFSERTVYRKYWAITRKIITLDVTSFIFVTPFLVSRTIDIWNDHVNDVHSDGSSFTAYFSLSLLLVCAHQIVSPIFILCSYHECRFIVLKTILCCSQSLQQNLEHQYKQHYATYIITVQKKAEGHNGRHLNNTVSHV